MADCDVLIAGAGPTGLVLALWLAKLGVQVRIIDKTAEPGTTSRALAVQARTLELYQQLDLTGAVLARGHRTPAVNLWVKGKRAARVPFEDVGAGLTPYPFLHIFPQDEHEQLLVARLEAAGVHVARGTTIESLDEEADGIVRARGKDANGPVAFTARSSPAATARGRPCAPRSARASPAGRTSTSSTSPTLPPAVGR